MRGFIVALFALLLAGGATAQDYTSLFPDLQEMDKGRKATRSGRHGDAHEHYLIAAAYGNKEAQKLVGLEYIEGRGVDADAARAHAWLRLASTLGEDLRVKKALLELEGALDEDAVKAAERHFRSLEKKYGDKKALKKRKLWARKQLRGASSGARRPNRLEQTQIQINNMYYRVSMGEYMDALEGYADEFEEQMKAAD